MQPVLDTFTQALGEFSKAKDGVVNSVSGLQETLKSATDALDKIKSLGQ